MSTRKNLAIAVALVALTACDTSEPADVPEANSPTPTTEKPKKKAGDDDRYATRAPASEATVGEKSDVVVAIEPRGDLKINKEFPWKINFDEPTGATLAASAFGAKEIELTDEAARIPLSITAKEAGKIKLSATGNFSVCNPQRCDILRDEPLEFDVVAVAPAEPAEAAEPQAQ